MTPESLVEMARRHIQEGEERIARQKLLMSKLARDGHQHAWLQASDVLNKLEALQHEAEEHLATAIKLTQNYGGRIRRPASGAASRPL
jgi:hypothetical protein